MMVCIVVPMLAKAASSCALLATGPASISITVATTITSVPTF